MISSYLSGVVYPDVLRYAVGEENKERLWVLSEDLSGRSSATGNFLKVRGRQTGASPDKMDLGSFYTEISSPILN